MFLRFLIHFDSQLKAVVAIAELPLTSSVGRLQSSGKGRIKQTPHLGQYTLAILEEPKNAEPFQIMP